MWLPRLGCSYPSLIFLTVHEHTLCCCPLKYVEVCAWWCLYQGIICGLGEMAMPSESGCSGMASGLRGADSVAVCVVLDVMHNLVELEDTQETSGPCERGVKHPPAG